MILYIPTFAGFVIFLIFGIVRRSTNNSLDVLLLSCLGLLSGFVVGAVLLILGGNIYGSLAHQESSVYAEYQLMNLQDNQSLSGSFFLGTGKISNEPTYVFYRQDENGGYVYREIPIDWATVFPEDRSDGVERVIVNRTTDKLGNYLFGTQEEYKYEFHIPLGSITPVFKLDAQ